MNSRANPLTSLPEVAALEKRQNLIRIPGEQDVPVTPRIRSIIDSVPFRRLARISQLGLVSLVYPGATHSRLEHSLGVYRNTLLFLRRLSEVPEFCEVFTVSDAEALIAAALLHDIGHWPYCHPLEDMKLPQIPEHESLARMRIDQSAIVEILLQQFDCGIDQVMALLTGAGKRPAERLCMSILSGPIDVDKMDYLYRDSLHAGVPYGMHFDRQRLIGSLCVSREDWRLAITDKGCTAAELMVFARYVMFSEVYWHHAVRSATAMLLRVVYGVRDQLDFQLLFNSDDSGFASAILEQSRGTACLPLAEGIFGEQRKLYKRIAQFTVLDDAEIFLQLSQRPYSWLAKCAELLAESLESVCKEPVSGNDILIDAPPPGLEIQFGIPVRFDNPERYRWLGDVSPVVKTLANEQFDNYVKRVRVFVHPRLAERLRTFGKIQGELVRIIKQLDVR